MGGDNQAAVQNNEPHQQHKAVTDSTLAKFMIGFIAGCAVVTIPKLSALFVASKPETAAFFDLNYIALIIIFGLFLGGVTAILEYKRACPPKDTFFSALAIPAILAGSMNTAVESNKTEEATKKANEFAEYIKNIKDYSGVEEDASAVEIIPLSSNDVTPQYQFSLIKQAHAEDMRLRPEQNVLDFSVKREVPQYSLVIEKATDKNQAISKTRELRKKLPSATLIKTPQNYKIITSKNLMTKTEAIEQAIKLEKDLAVKPQLLKLK